VVLEILWCWKYCGAGNTVVQGAAQAVIARPVAAAYARRDQNSTHKSMAETEKK